MGRDNQPEPLSFGSYPLNGNVPIHGEPNLKGFFFSGDRSYHDSYEPEWAAVENTPAAVHPGASCGACQRGIPQDKKTWVIHNFLSINRCLMGLLGH
jgi:hypothetical protein